MTKKLIELTESSAVNIEAIKIGDSKMLSLRKMYKTKKDPNWKPARQGITLPYDEAERILKKALKMLRDPDTKFKKLEPKGKDDE